MAKKDNTYEAHVYMPKDVLQSLTARAAQECRSVNQQILYYVQVGLKRDEKK